MGQIEKFSVPPPTQRIPTLIKQRLHFFSVSFFLFSYLSFFFFLFSFLFSFSFILFFSSKFSFSFLKTHFYFLYFFLFYFPPFFFVFFFTVVSFFFFIFVLSLHLLFYFLFSFLSTCIFGFHSFPSFHLNSLHFFFFSLYISFHFFALSFLRLILSSPFTFPFFSSCFSTSFLYSAPSLFLIHPPILSYSLSLSWINAFPHFHFPSVHSSSLFHVVVFFTIFLLFTCLWTFLLLDNILTSSWYESSFFFSYFSQYIFGVRMAAKRYVWYGIFLIRRSSVQRKQNLTLHHGIAFSETKDSLCQAMSPKTFLFFSIKYRKNLDLSE